MWNFRIREDLLSWKMLYRKIPQFQKHPFCPVKKEMINDIIIFTPLLRLIKTETINLLYPSQLIADIIKPRKNFCNTPFILFEYSDLYCFW